MKTNNTHQAGPAENVQERQQREELERNGPIQEKQILKHDPYKQEPIKHKEGK